MTDSRPLFTIGHSTHTADHFLGAAATAQHCAARRRPYGPKSRRHPQFNGDALDNFLRGEGISYRHFPSLGGLRKPRPNSVNTAWQHPGFRGYADHMQTPEFRSGVLDLLAFAQLGATAVMCAEAVWWQCHRQLLADAVLAHGVPVRHILGQGEAKAHRMSEFARIIGSESLVSWAVVAWRGSRATRLPLSSIAREMSKIQRVGEFPGTKPAPSLSNPIAGA